MTLVAAWLTTLVVCVVGSFVPLVNTELYLLSAAALSPREFALPLATAATLGQMLGKVVVFYAGRGLLKLPGERLRRGAEAMRERLETRPRTAKLLLLSSATLGLPPLYVMSVACGAAGMGVAAFFLIGTLGRLIYYSGIVLLPRLAAGVVG